MLAAFAKAAFFITFLCMSVISGTFFVAFLASCLLMIIEQTASGNDEVVWPDEPFVDRLLKAVEFLWLTAVWVAPAGLLLRLAGPYVAPEATGWLVVAACALSFWLMFPVGVLSSQSAGSAWVVFRPKVIAAMLRRLPATLAFYGLSFVLVGASVAAVAGAAVIHWLLLAPLAAVVAITSLMVYARLLGRLGWQLAMDLASRPAEQEARAASAKAVKKKPARRAKRPRRPKTEVTDPWAVPKETKPMRTPWGGEAEPVEGYGLAGDAPSPPPPEEEKKPRNAWFPEEEAETPYEVSTPEEPRGPDVWVGEEPPHVPLPDELEMRHAAARTVPKLLPWRAVFAFPWYRESLRRWVWLSLFLTVVLILVHYAVVFYPGD